METLAVSQDCCLTTTLHCHPLLSSWYFVLYCSEFLSFFSFLRANLCISSKPTWLISLLRFSPKTRSLPHCHPHLHEAPSSLKCSECSILTLADSTLLIRLRFYRANSSLSISASPGGSKSRSTGFVDARLVPHRS